MITKMTIANLKAFGTEQTLEFACNANDSISKLTLLVGPNNSGKSTVIAAAHDLLTASPKIFTAPKEQRHGDNQPTLRVQHGEEMVSIQQNSGSKFVINGNTERIQNLIRYVPSRRPWTELFSSSMEEFQYRHNARSNLRSNRHWVDSSFGSALMQLSLDMKKKAEFVGLLKTIDPSIRDWRAETAGSQDYIEYESETGGWHRIGDVGDGISSLFRICFELNHLRQGETLLIDEPELSLHPQVQRNLAKLILKASLKNQIILATHSPHFVSWKGFKSGAIAYRFNMTAKGSKLSRLSDATMKKIISIADSDRKNVMLYDAVAKEVFFARGALFLEGPEDANILRSYIEGNELPDIEIFGYGSGGASKIVNWLTMCDELCIRGFGLYDGDQPDHFKAALSQFESKASISVEKLWTDDIRDKPEAGKTGIFDEDWKIKPEHDAALKALLKRIVDHVRPTEVAF